METGRGKLLFGMAGANRMDFSKAGMPLGNVTNILPDTPKTSRFDPQTMKSFMDGLNTNAEIRKDALKARQSSNNNTEDEVRRTSSVTKNNIETTPSGHLNFGIGFGTFVDNYVRVCSHLGRLVTTEQFSDQCTYLCCFELCDVARRRTTP